MVTMTQRSCSSQSAIPHKSRPSKCLGKTLMLAGSGSNRPLPTIVTSKCVSCSAHFTSNPLDGGELIFVSQLKPLREEQRAKAIKQGLIPDPSKPMRLDQATDFEGTCEEMCPEWEREEREYQNNVDPLERVSRPSPA